MPNPDSWNALLTWNFHKLMIVHTGNPSTRGHSMLLPMLGTALECDLADYESKPHQLHPENCYADYRNDPTSIHQETMSGAP